MQVESVIEVGVEVEVKSEAKVNQKKRGREDKDNDEFERMNGDLEFIDFEKFELLNLCGKKTCGGKVMCFKVKYEGKEYVMKEGRKSMGYNWDYELVDGFKEMFGLKKIGMKRILSNMVLKKKDKEVSTWEGNFEWKKEEGAKVVYSMMNVVEGLKLIDYGRKMGKSYNVYEDEELMKEYLKIGFFRWIFGVTDMSTINVMINDKRELISIDEHGLFSRDFVLKEGERKKIKKGWVLKSIEEMRWLLNDDGKKKKLIEESMRDEGQKDEIKKRMKKLLECQSEDEEVLLGRMEEGNV